MVSLPGPQLAQVGDVSAETDLLPVIHPVRGREADGFEKITVFVSTDWLFRGLELVL